MKEMTVTLPSRDAAARTMVQRFRQRTGHTGCRPDCPFARRTSFSRLAYAVLSACLCVTQARAATDSARLADLSIEELQLSRLCRRVGREAPRADRPPLGSQPVESKCLAA